MMKAEETFHAEPWRHNCAQAVAYKWRAQYAEKDVVSTYSAHGGGRAPEGCCGALYAAMNACPSQAEEIRKKFLEKVGATHCREIRREGCVSCKECVATADGILEELLRGK